MPTGTCSGCGRLTNSTTSNCWESEGKEWVCATECYAAYDGKKWVKGCAYDKLSKDNFLLTFANSVLKNGKIKKILVG